MLKDMRVCTISKYPPYMSGHSFEALYQGKALLEMTGEKHYEVTYDQSVYDKATNYNNSPELMLEAEQYLNVYRMFAGDRVNIKVLDGALVKAFVGQVINLIVEKDINVLSTFYLDPHAYIANQAKLYAQVVLGKKIITAHKAVGSDVLNSIANHRTDGEGKFLLLQLLSGDIMLAVSLFTKVKIPAGGLCYPQTGSPRYGAGHWWPGHFFRRSATICPGTEHPGCHLYGHH